MFKYQPCPQCGDYSSGIDWSGIVEYSTGIEQTCTVSCSSCMFQISITINPESRLVPNKIEQVLKETWNKMYEVSK